MTEDFLPYGRQTINEADRLAVDEALQSALVTRGPQVEAFERMVAERVEAEYAVAFSSGTSALQAAYFAGGCSSIDRIVATPNSFFASIIGLSSGAQVEFIDIERSTGQLDPKKVEEAFSTPMTRGKRFFVPVHFGGAAPDMAALTEEIRDPYYVVIEDAAHSLGSSYPTGEAVGSCAYSDMTIFSFHPVKTICCGEGGMVTTQDEELYQRLLLFRNNGMVRKPELGQWAYQVEAISGNYNLTDLQAALGVSQMKRLDEVIEKRRELVTEYRKRLPGVRFFDAEPDSRTCYHLMVAQFDFEAMGKSRQEVMDQLRERGIGSQVHYVPQYHHPVVPHGEQWRDRCPEMEAYYASALSLPLYPAMEREDVERVAKAIEEVCGSVAV